MAGAASFQARKHTHRRVASTGRQQALHRLARVGGRVCHRVHGCRVKVVLEALQMEDHGRRGGGEGDGGGPRRRGFAVTSAANAAVGGLPPQRRRRRGAGLRRD
jgi:hypothetical protein